MHNPTIRPLRLARGAALYITVLVASAPILVGCVFLAVNAIPTHRLPAEKAWSENGANDVTDTTLARRHVHPASPRSFGLERVR
jgi:hypothetical protein